MANLSVLSTQTNAISALSNVALVVPQVAGLFGLNTGPQFTTGYQPQNPQSLLGQVGGNQQALLFHYEGENRATIESDITDHFVEDNTAIQDQIALRPEVITVHGFIGELNDVPPLALQPLAAAVSTLTALGAYVPGLSVTAQLAYNNAFQAYQGVNTASNAAISALSTLSGEGGTTVINGVNFSPIQNQNKQQTMFQNFYGYWLNRTLFTVQTPWAVFQNMAILRLVATQDADTSVITDFEVTFKIIRMASTATSSSITSGRFSSQSAGSSNLGTQTPPFSLGIGNFSGLGG